MIILKFYAVTSTIAIVLLVIMLAYVRQQYSYLRSKVVDLIRDDIRHKEEKDTLEIKLKIMEDRLTKETKKNTKY